jgi:hypothetical protein
MPGSLSCAPQDAPPPADQDRVRLTGLLVAAAAAAVLGLGGCSVLGLGGSSGSGGSGGSGGSAGSAGGNKVQLPQNTSYQGGQAVPSPSPAVGGSPYRTPLAALPSLPAPTVAFSYNPRPVGTVCQGRLREGVVNGLDVTPLGGGRAQVRWWEVGDPALQGYKLVAVSQQLVYGPQPPLKWINVAKAGRCVQVTTTVTGLKPGDPYIFVLHAVIQNYESVPPIIPEIARSPAVIIT